MKILPLRGLLRLTCGDVYNGPQSVREAMTCFSWRERSCLARQYLRAAPRELRP